MSTTPTLSASAPYVDSWLLESTALAQRTLVEEQLKRPNKAQPFYHYVQVLAALGVREPKIEAGYTLLDVGCGVGHYGVLTQHLTPRVQYVGTDTSPHMLEHTIFPEGKFIHRAFEDNEFDAYDVVLLSQVLEMTNDPRNALRLAVGWMRDGAWLILHRLRHDDVGERVVYEPTYGNLPAQNYIWDLESLRLELEGFGRVCLIHDWNDQQTVSLLFHRCLK